MWYTNLGLAADSCRARVKSTKRSCAWATEPCRSVWFSGRFSDSEAFDELRDDDNPFIEGLFHRPHWPRYRISLESQFWPGLACRNVEAVLDIVLGRFSSSLVVLASSQLRRWRLFSTWDMAWRVFLPCSVRLIRQRRHESSGLAVGLILSWLLYSLLAHGLLHGWGAALRHLGDSGTGIHPFSSGLGFVPFLVGGALNTWQLILRYKAVRSAHGLRSR